MPVTYGKDIIALRIASRLNRANDSVSRAQERLTTGARINHASDDAAGLALLSSLRLSSRLFSQAERNINDGLSKLGIAEGTLNALGTIAQRQLELATQAANGSVSRNQRRALDQESNALTEEWNRIVASTKFNGMSVFDQARLSTSLQAGESGSNSLTISTGQELSRTVGTGIFTSSFTLTSLAGAIYWRNAGDYNRDGNQDLAYYSQTNSKMMVTFGNGDGTFKAGSSYSVGAVDSNYIASATSVDVNGDGALDILAPVSTDTGIAVILNNGNGTFNAAVRYGNGGLSDVKFADLNGDGKGDLVGSGANGAVRVMFGNGDGTFLAPIAQSFGTGLNQFDLGDVNEDGILDIVGGNGTSGLHVLLGNGNGTFKSGTLQIGTSGSASAKIADFDYDGIMDIATSDYNYPSYANRVHILLGNGNGTFKASTSYSLDAAFDLVLADINNDGLVDIAGRALNTTVQVLLSNGDGSFNARLSTAIAGNSYTTVFADFNNDGVLDMSGESVSGSVYLAQTAVSFDLPFLDLSTQIGARSAMDSASEALARVANELSSIGASQARLEIAASNLSTQRVAYDEAASRISDIDVASEVSELIRSQILQQISAQLLGQHQLNSRIVLQLLKN